MNVYVLLHERLMSTSTIIAVSLSKAVIQTTMKAWILKHHPYEVDVIAPDHILFADDQMLEIETHELTDKTLYFGKPLTRQLQVRKQDTSVGE